jgi:hypothetical protein
MDYLYKLLPVELVSIIEKKLHEMYFVDTIKKLNAINNLLLTEKYPRYTSYNNKSKEEVDNYFNTLGKEKGKDFYMNKSSSLLDLIQRSEMGIFLMSLEILN